MTTKSGLLPKWILLHTISRVLSVVFRWQFYSKTLGIKNLQPWFAVLAVLWGLLRVQALRKITNPKYFFALTLSFVLEGLFFIYGKYVKVYSTRQMILEVFVALFTTGWMVFLYPYYLLHDDKKKKM